MHAPDAGGSTTAGTPARTNRLAREKSPYLLQHAHNPVDWYPWGAEAFARARAEDKPIFLSIGYSTCHWCHVMERESFENDDVAALLNAYFVPVKVDREERPDVDRVYMTAMQDLLLEVLQQEGKTVMLITHSVEEAVYLSSRIVVMTARPTRIREVIEVPFGYPRRESLHESREFGELRSHVRDLVMKEYAAQARQGNRNTE